MTPKLITKTWKNSGARSGWLLGRANITPDTTQTRAVTNGVISTLLAISRGQKPCARAITRRSTTIPITPPPTMTVGQ